MPVLDESLCQGSRLCSAVAAKNVHLQFNWSMHCMLRGALRAATFRSWARGPA